MFQVVEVPVEKKEKTLLPVKGNYSRNTSQKLHFLEEREDKKKKQVNV